MLTFFTNRVHQRPGIGMALVGILAVGLFGFYAVWAPPVAPEQPRVPANNARIPVLLAAHEGDGVAQQRFREVLLQRPAERWVDPATDEPLSEEAIRLLADSAHLAVYTEERFPSANECATCHPDHYRAWSVSQHAYAQMSPVFNALHGKIQQLTNGTNGDFCIR